MKYVYTQEQIREQRKKDDLERAALWKKLYAEAGGGERGAAVTSAMQELYSLYDTAIIDWSACLYDKEIGGFYPNTTARDYLGFLPDPQCTVQMFWFFQGTGLLRAFDGSLQKGFPKLLEKIPYFIKPLQDENGYFYNPHWSKESADHLISRRGRDLSWCTSLLSYCGARPTYDTPNGVCGDGLDAFGNPVSKADKSSSKGESADMRSDTTVGEKQAKTAPFPDYLSTESAFRLYLSGLDIKGASYRVGNELNATVSQFKAREATLKDEGAGWSVYGTLTDWLYENIDPSTGYWSSSASFGGVNGFFKIIMVYNIIGIPYPEDHIEAATRTVLSCLAGDEESPWNICSIYNVWSAVAFIRENLKYFGEATKKQVEDMIASTLYSELGAAAIRKTKEKLAKYKRDDGGFSHAYTAVAPSHQSLPVSTGTILAGDVDATTIGVSGISTQIFKSFGFERVPVFMHSDYMRYVNILENLPPVVKTKLQDPVANFEFGHDKRFTPFGGAEASIVFDGASHSLSVKPHGKGGGLFIIPTARLYEGDLVRFEADITICRGTDLILSLQEVSKKCAQALSLSEKNGTIILSTEIAEYSLASAGEKFTLRLDYEKEAGLRVYSNGCELCRLPPLYNANLLALERFELLSEAEGGEICLDEVSFYLAEK